MTITERPVEIHQHHRDVTGGWLRPAVFGVMDGLVSNAALIVGVVGGGAAAPTVAVAGLAGLVAGACSMAAGEYTSVVSQTELIKGEIATERAELAKRPEEEERELALMYQERGLEAGLAAQVAHQLHQDPEIAWRVHAREELGIDPDDLPSPWVAAGSSFLAFTIGAFIPLLPFLLGRASLGAAVVLSVLALFAAGAVVARLTGRSAWFGGARQLLLGAIAAAVTFGVGALVGPDLGVG